MRSIEVKAECGSGWSIRVRACGFGRGLCCSCPCICLLLQLVVVFLGAPLEGWMALLHRNQDLYECKF
jgi:hypothetical protein